MATVSNIIIADLKVKHPNAFIGELPNYTGDPNNCVHCKGNVEDFDNLYIFDPENDGIDPKIYCDVVCFSKYFLVN